MPILLNENDFIAVPLTKWKKIKEYIKKEENLNLEQEIEFGFLEYNDLTEKQKQLYKKSLKNNKENLINI